MSKSTLKREAIMGKRKSPGWALDDAVRKNYTNFDQRRARADWQFMKLAGFTIVEIGEPQPEPPK